MSKRESTIIFTCDIDKHAIIWYNTLALTVYKMMKYIYLY